MAQLRDLGLSKHRVRHRVRTGRLHPLHRGVYSVGHANPSQEGRWLAATLAIGNGAVLSHRAAASLWGLLPAATAVVDVSVPGQGGRRQRKGIRVHRCASLGADAVTRRRRIPVTTPTRTIADLRGIATPEEQRRARRQAGVLGLRIALDGDDVSADRTRSELEHLFLKLCALHGLSRPDVNVRIGPWIVDFTWPVQRLIVETDGYRYHRGRVAFEQDRARDLHLRSRGYEVIRLTYDQVVGKPEETAIALRAVLAARTSSRGG